MWEITGKREMPMHFSVTCIIGRAYQEDVMLNAKNVVEDYLRQYAQEEEKCLCVCITEGVCVRVAPGSALDGPASASSRYVMCAGELAWEMNTSNVTAFLNSLGECLGERFASRHVRICCVENLWVLEKKW